MFKFAIEVKTEDGHYTMSLFGKVPRELVMTKFKAIAWIAAAAGSLTLLWK